MSHVAQGKAVIKSLDDLDAAANRLGGKLMRGVTKARWYQAGFVDDSTTWRDFFSPEEAARISALPRAERVAIINHEMGRADHIIQFPGASYDVAAMKMDDGTFRLRWDKWSNGGGLHRYIGANGDKLAQAYTIEATKRAVRRQGFGVKEIPQSNGHVKLKLLVQ